MPPGMAMKPSDSSAIMALRSCMSLTTKHARQAGVADFALDQRARNHAGRFAAEAQHLVGDHAHQADVAAAVDQADVVRDQHLRQRARGVGVQRD